MDRLEGIVAELKSLTPGKLEQAASFIHRLKYLSHQERQLVLQRTSGSLTREEAGEIERIIEEGCERIDERDW